MESKVSEDLLSSFEFDGIINDIFNNVQNEEDDTLLDQLLEELPLTSCNESSLLPDGTGDFTSPDLSELPLEDFTNLESILSDVFSEEIGNKVNGVQSQDVLDLTDDSFNLEDIFEDASTQSSPLGLQENENEFNNLLNSVFDSDFMQEFAALESGNAEVSDASILVSNSSTNEHYSPLIKSGVKRKLPDSDQNTAPKNDQKVIPLRIKNNETEKEAIRRIKNNEASKITRAKRRRKHDDLFKQQTELEKSNAQLRMRIEIMQKEAEILRQVLISKLSNCNN